MYIDTLIQGMPDSSVEKVTDCLQKLETNNYISTQEAKDAYEICKNHHSYLSDDDAKMGLIRLCAKAWEFNDIEMRALEHIRQRRETLQNLSEPQYYASIVNIAQKINFQYDYFRPISEINQTFNELSNDRDLRTLLDINRYLNLSEPLMVELMKSQYQQSFNGNHQTDELIQRIDQAGKLSELPETAFNNLSSYLIKQVNDNVHHDAKIDDSSKSEAFKKALKEQSLSDDEAQKILPTYDELCANNKNSVLPRTLDDKCKQLEAEQKSKQKSIAPAKIQELFNKFESNQNLSPLQTYHLYRYVNHSLDHDMPPHDRIKFERIFKDIPSELRVKGAQWDELFDDKSIAVIAGVLEQIKSEHSGGTKKFTVPYLTKDGKSVELHITSNFMELRVAKDVDEDEIKKLIDNIKDNNYPNGIPENIDGFSFRVHEGIDITGWGHDGVAIYQPDTTIQSTHAEIINTYPDEEGMSIVMMEFHKDNGILFTTLRHLDVLKVKKGDKLEDRQPLGSYRLKEVDKYGNKRYHHPHIEQLIIKKEDFPDTESTQALLAELKKLYQRYDEESESYASQKDLTKDITDAELQSAKFLNSRTVQMLNPLRHDASYHSVSLLTTGTRLNQELLNAMESEWLRFSDPLISGGVIKNADDFLDIIKGTGLLRDHLKLKALHQILAKAKSMHTEMETDTRKLDTLMTNIETYSNELLDEWLALHPEAEEAIKDAIKNVGEE